MVTFTAGQISSLQLVVAKVTEHELAVKGIKLSDAAVMVLEVLENGAVVWAERVAGIHEVVSRWKRPWAVHCINHCHQGAWTGPSIS